MHLPGHAAARISRSPRRNAAGGWHPANVRRVSRPAQARPRDRALRIGHQGAMFAGSHYQLMAEYNRWMNGRLYAICADLPDAERRRDRGAFFKSVHGTLNHMYCGDQAWFGRFTQRPMVSKIGHEFFATFEELRAARKQDSMTRWSPGQNTLAEEWLRSPITYKSSVDGKTRTLPAWLLVVHIYEPSNPSSRAIDDAAHANGHRSGRNRHSLVAGPGNVMAQSGTSSGWFSDAPCCARRVQHNAGICLRC